MNDKSMQAGHGGNIWAASRKWGQSPELFLDFSANINPLGPSKRSLNAINESLGLLEHYPEPTCQELKHRLGVYLGIEPGYIVLGNGGSELIYLLARIFGQKRIVRLAPTFTEYGEGLERPHIVEVPLTAENGFRLPLTELMAVMEKGDLVFLGNPNNPTGNLFARSELEKVVRRASEVGAMVAIDEAFIDFTGDRSKSMRDLATNTPVLVVLGSLTKFFAIPALRLGYAVAAKEHVKHLEKLLPAWRINALAQAAAVAGLQDVEYIRQTVQVVDAEREFLVHGLEQIGGLKIHPSAANFLLVDGSQTGVKANALQAKLGPEGILIRLCDNFSNLSPFHFRLAVRNRHDNERLLGILEKVLVKA
ncbi:MAG: threonine-phosphate decarboxylase CobD [Syntrophomonadaceae bacterium]